MKANRALSPAAELMGIPAASEPEIESPCIGTCTLGPDSLCVGCFRTADEIAAWLSLSVDQRRAVMQSLPERARRRSDGSAQP